MRVSSASGNDLGPDAGDDGGDDDDDEYDDGDDGEIIEAKTDLSGARAKALLPECAARS